MIILVALMLLLRWSCRLMVTKVLLTVRVIMYTGRSLLLS